MSEPLFVTIEVDRTAGWTAQIVEQFPTPNVRYELGWGLELLGISEWNTATGIVLIGTQSWGGYRQSDEATLKLLIELRRRGFPRAVVYLTDLHATDEAKAPFLQAFPGLRILSKTAVANGTQPLPFG